MDKSCGTCYYGSGEGDFRYCLNEAHPGMAFSKHAVCDHWDPSGKIEDAGTVGSSAPEDE